MLIYFVLHFKLKNVFLLLFRIFIQNLHPQTQQPLKETVMILSLNSVLKVFTHTNMLFDCPYGYLVFINDHASNGTVCMIFFLLMSQTGIV